MCVVGEKGEGHQGELETELETALKQHIVGWGLGVKGQWRRQRPREVREAARPCERTEWEPPITKHCFFGCKLVSPFILCSLQTGHQLFLPAQYPFLLALAS